MQNNTKFIILIPILAAILLVFGISTLAGAANPSPGPTDDAHSNLLYDGPNLYLPLVGNNFCTPQPVESPFSISIAALHQISTTNFRNQAMTEAQYYAWYDQAFPTLISALAESDAGYTRVYIKWSDIEPLLSQPPVYNWQWYDDRLIQIAQAGIKIIAVIGAIPPWAESGGTVCPPISQGHLEDYESFLTALVTRYSQSPYNVKHWEIFNEADYNVDARTDSHACYGNFGSNYAEILSLSYPIIKTIDSGATVLTSGIAYDWFNEYDGPFYRYFSDYVMSAGGASHFDALNFHYFPDFRLEWERWNPPANPPTCGDVEDGLELPYDGSGIDVIAKKNHYTNRMKTCWGVNKPVWLTELAEHGFPSDTASLRNQAYYVIKGYTRSLAAAIKNITWYALATPNDDFEMSLLFDDLSPKPAFNTYKTLVAQLTDYQYDRTLSLPGGEAYVFSNSCQDERVVAWGNNVPLTVSPAKSLEVTNYLGEVTPIQDGGAGDQDGTPNGSIQVLLPLDLMGSTKVPNPVPIPVFIRVTAK